MKLYLRIFPFVLIIGCSHFSKKSESGQITETADQVRLRNYLANRPFLSIPITITQGTKSIFTSDTTSVPRTDWMHFYVDKKLHKIFENDSIYAMISYFPAGAGGLALETMDKAGNNIESIGLISKHDNTDPGYSALEWVRILPDLTVIVSDSITSYKLDVNEIPIQSSKAVSIEVNKYRILGSGKIEKIE